MKQSFLVTTLLVCFLGCRQANQEKEEPLNTRVSLCKPVTSDKAWYTSNKKAPLFEGMGTVQFPASTRNPLVQQYINQGLLLAYGFNHAEAARSFYYASRLDSNCALAYWGYAYVLGPNYNAGMESDNYERAYAAIQTARRLAEQHATEKEKDLIDALARRYVRNPVKDRSPLDQAYAQAMKTVYQKYPSDPDVNALYAESLMNLHPWDLQDKNGNDKKWTPEIISILEKCIAAHPKHPGANHFYIHAVEASNRPDRALRSAKLFDDGLVPNSGHLVHMPSHVYIRTGDYHKGTRANIQALKVDSTYVTASNAQGAYPLAYYPHNQHFMVATATLEGNSKWAIYAAEELQKKANPQLMREPGWGTIQHYYTIPAYVYVKFGEWDKILAIRNEVSDLDYPTAILLYARGMAYLGKGDLKAAKYELQALEKISRKEELKKVTIWDINTAFELVQIAKRLLKAEILAQEDDFAQSISLLREAVALEDALNYNEPPDWFFSIRHHLGAIQLKAGQSKEAIKTYKEDLNKLPKNGWALKGLSLAYEKVGDKANQDIAESNFKEAWKTADIQLTSSVK